MDESMRGKTIPERRRIIAAAREAASNGQHHDEPAPDPEPPAGAPKQVAHINDLIRAGSAVHWLWETWAQIGVLTAIAAEGGKGKTRFCADLLRRIRHGLPWPDGQAMTLPPDSRALWVVADNNHDELVTLCQDFNIVGGVWINAWTEDPYGGVSLDEARDLADLDLRIASVKPAIVIIDTVGNATDRCLNRQEEAKAFYFPLQVLARRHQCAILPLTHLNTSGKFLGRRVLEKVRIAIKIDQPDPDTERRRIRVEKAFGKKPRALGLDMGDHGNEYDDNPPKEPDIDAGEPGKAGRPPAEIVAAKKWLIDQLTPGPKRVSHLRNLSESAGISTGTLYNAMRSLGVEEYEAESRKWWRLPTPDNPW